MAGKTFNRRNDLMLNMGEEESIEVKPEILGGQDDTIDELFKQPGFGSIPRPSNLKLNPDESEHNMSIDKISFESKNSKVDDSFEKMFRLQSTRNLD